MSHMLPFKLMIVALIIGVLVGSLLIELSYYKIAPMTTEAPLKATTTLPMTTPLIFTTKILKTYPPILLEKTSGIYGVSPFSSIGIEFKASIASPYEKISIEYISPSDIENFDQLVDRLKLRGEHIRFLLERGFFAAPTRAPNPLIAYTYFENLRLPLYITIDSALQTYLLILDHILANVEEDYLSIWLREVVEDTYYIILDYGLEKGFNDEINTALIYLGVPLYMYYGELPEENKVPEHVRRIVKNEVELILEHEGWSISPLLKTEIDYSLFKVRGHYTKSDRLSKYFRAIAWLGLIKFEDEDFEAATLISLALNSSRRLWRLWTKIDSIITFLVGTPEDLTPREIVEILKSQNITLDNYEDYKVDAVRILKSKFRGLCFSFIPQRKTLDQKIFNNLTHENVPNRFIPKGLDVAACLGYEHALEYLKEDIKRYEEYEDVLLKIKEHVESLDSKEWYRSLHHSVLHISKGMYSEAMIPQVSGAIKADEQSWLDRILTTTLASWSIYRHHTIAYISQVEMGFTATVVEMRATLTTTPTPAGMIVIPKKPHPGVVDPLPLAWSRLVILVNSTINGLDKLNILSYKDRERLEDFLQLCIELRDLSVKEVKGDVTSDDLKVIEEYVERLSKILRGLPGVFIRPKDPDVFTSPYTKEILFAETGFLDAVVVVYKAEDGKLYGAVGTMLTYYEFTGEKRLTDEEWLRLLIRGEEKGLPVWTSSYRTKTPIYMAGTPMLPVDFMRD